MDITQIREKFVENDKRFEGNIRQLLADAPCDDKFRAYLLDVTSKLHEEMQQIQAELISLAEKNTPLIYAVSFGKILRERRCDE